MLCLLKLQLNSNPTNFIDIQGLLTKMTFPKHRHLENRSLNSLDRTPIKVWSTLRQLKIFSQIKIFSKFI